MKLLSILRCIIVSVMFCGFLLQMWDLFEKYLSGLTTVAVSFKEREVLEFPSFAFCDSRAFKTDVNLDDTLLQYNATTFQLDQEVQFSGVSGVTGAGNISFSEINHTIHVVPSTFNGYCKLFEFHQSYPAKSYLGEFALSVIY